MKFHNFICLDFETGGLDKKNNFHAITCPITEVAIMGLQANTLEEIVRYTSYVKGRYSNGRYIGYSQLHDQEYQEGAIKATGITKEILEENGQDYKKVCSDIIEVFEKCHSGSNFHKSVLFGHNIGYDIPFLQYLFKLCKKDLSKYLQGYYNHETNFCPVFFDTQYLSRAKSIDENQKHNLTDVAIREGFEPQDMHKAMNDVIITVDIFKKYILSLRNSSNNNKDQEISLFRDSFKFEY